MIAKGVLLLGIPAVATVLACLLAGCPQYLTTGGDAGETNPLGPNAGCYVCHMTFVKEPLSRMHLRHKVYCIKCHGPSIAHANDEDVGATKPDIFFKRGQIDVSCRKCHPTHDADPAKVIARWQQRKLTRIPPTCTECHGAHKVKRPDDAKTKPAKRPSPTTKPTARSDG